MQNNNENNNNNNNSTTFEQKIITNNIINKLNDINNDITFFDCNNEDNLNEDQVKKLINNKKKLQNLKYYIYKTNKICQDIIDNNTKKIYNNCKHNWVPDRTAFDPCRTIHMCTKCDA